MGIVAIRQQTRKALPQFTAAAPKEAGKVGCGKEGLVNLVTEHGTMEEEPASKHTIKQADNSL